MPHDTMDPSGFDQTEQLVRRAQQGDGEALESLFRRYLPRVRRIAGIRLGRSAQAFAEVEDLVQESLLDALCGLDRFEPRSEGSFCHWLSRCVENNVRDAWRHGRTARRGAGKVRPFSEHTGSGLRESRLPGDATTPSEAALGHEMDDRIEAALLGLRDNYREAIILRTVCGMTAREMAEEMELANPESAQKLFERARRALAERLDP